MATQTSQSASYVFLSYASADRERALQTADLLEAQGISVWIDRKSIAGGTSWSAEIVRGIRGCAAFVVACTPSAMSSPNVQQEVQLAWESRRPILPLILAQTKLPEAIAYALASRQWIEVLDRPDEDWVPLAVQALGGMGVVAARQESPIEGLGPTLTHSGRTAAAIRSSADSTAAASPSSMYAA